MILAAPIRSSGAASHTSALIVDPSPRAGTPRHARAHHDKGARTPCFGAVRTSCLRYCCARARTAGCGRNRYATQLMCPALLRGHMRRPRSDPDLHRQSLPPPPEEDNLDLMLKKPRDWQQIKQAVLMAFELPKSFAESAVRSCRLFNTVLDFIFYDVPTLRAALAEKDAPMRARREKMPSRIIEPSWIPPSNAHRPIIESPHPRAAAATAGSSVRARAQFSS
jgi:hypothetical protein